jgi:hypothetical protein
MLKSIFLVGLLWLCVLACNRNPEGPKSYQLPQNYPNPFPAQTEIKYEVPDSCQVTIVLMNVEGKLVDTLINELQVKGAYVIDLTKISKWSEMPAGVYFYTMSICDQSATKKLVVQK